MLNASQKSRQKIFSWLGYEKLGKSSWDNSESVGSGNWNSFYFLPCFLHPLCMPADLPFSLDLNTKNPGWYFE